VIYANIVPYTLLVRFYHTEEIGGDSQQFLWVPLPVTLISLAASSEHPSLPDTKMDENNPELNTNINISLALRLTQYNPVIQSS